MFLLVRLLQTPRETCLGEVCRALPSTPLPLAGSTFCPVEFPLLPLLHHHVRAGGSTQPFLSQGEPKLSAQMKAVSAECLGPPLDVSTKNITKSLASLVDLILCHPLLLPPSIFPSIRVRMLVTFFPPTLSKIPYQHLVFPFQSVSSAGLDGWSPFVVPEW